MRSYLRDKYNDKDQRKYLSKKELKFISAYNEPKAEPILNTNFKISPLPVFQPPKQNPEMLKLKEDTKQFLKRAKEKSSVIDQQD